MAVLTDEGVPDMAQLVFEMLSPAGKAGLDKQFVIAPPLFVGVNVIAELAV